MFNLFIRDASIMYKKKEVNYTDSLQRLDLAFNKSIANNLSIQITLNKTHYLNNFRKLNKQINIKSKFVKKITIHLTAYYHDLFANDKRTELFVEKVNEILKKNKNIVGICVHPDHLVSWKHLKKLKNKNTYLAIEVTDKKAFYGNKISHLEGIFSKNSYLKLVIDTSHIKELEKEKILTFNKFFKKFSKRIVEAQVSDFGNFYKDKMINTTHSLLSIKKDSIIKRQIKKLHAKNKNINIVIEGLLPFGKIGDEMLKNEISYLRNIIY